MTDQTESLPQGLPRHPFVDQLLKAFRTNKLTWVGARRAGAGEANRVGAVDECGDFLSVEALQGDQLVVACAPLGLAGDDIAKLPEIVPARRDARLARESANVPAAGAAG